MSLLPPSRWHGTHLRGEALLCRVGGKLLLCLALLLSFVTVLCTVLCPVAHAESRRPTTPPLAEAGVRVPFGGQVNARTAGAIAGAAARIRALAKISDRLDSDLAAHLGATDPDQLRALACAVYSVTLSTATLSAAPDTPADMLAVTARIWASPRNIEAEIRNALRHPDNLELRFLTLRGMEKLVTEGLDLLQRSHRNRQTGHADSDAPFAARLEHLAGQLETRRIYLDALRRFDGTWHDAQEVALLLKKALERDPENPLLHLGLGEALLLLDRPYEALDALHSAAKLPDAPARTFYMRGIAHLRLHLPTYADDDFTRALERRPEKAAWWRARGAARLVAGNTESMCADFYQACALGDCDGLAEVRTRELCLELMPPADVPPSDILPASVPPETGAFSE